MTLDVGRVVEVFRRLLESRGLVSANRYLLAVADAVIHEVAAGVLGVEEAAGFAASLRDALMEYADSVNPFIMRVLGDVEDAFEYSSIDEVLGRIWELWRRGRLDKLEV